MISASRTLALADYLPRSVRGVTLGRQPMWWPAKVAGELADFSIDLAAELAANGDALVGAMAAISPSSLGGAIIADLTAAGTVVTFWVTDGLPGTFYTATLNCLTRAGRRLQYAVSLPVVPPFEEAGQPKVPALAATRSMNVLIDTNGAPVTDTFGATITIRPPAWTLRTLTDTNGRTVTSTRGLAILTS